MRSFPAIEGVLGLVRVGFVLGAGALLGACSSSGSSSSSGPGQSASTGKVTTAVTYQKDVRPLIEEHCLGCHVDQGIAPFRLDDWSDVSDHSYAVVAQVAGGTMPPWPADDACHPLRDSAALPDDVRAVFTAWKKDGFQQGDEADYVAPAKPKVVDLGPPDVVMDPGETYVTPRDVNDNYRCFLMQGGFDKDTYIKAVDIEPGQRTTVHHVQIHTIPGAGLAQAQSLDAADDGPGWTCSGGSGVTGDYNLFSWRPGTTTAAFETGDAVLVEAGTKVVIQVHYNTQHLADGEAVPPDLTKVQFWTLPDGQIPDRIVRRQGIIAFTLNIAPGDPSYATKQTWSLASMSLIGPRSTFVPGEIIGQTPHMHQIGTRLHVTRTDAAGTDSCMVDVPRWNFEWQMDYFYDPAAAVPFAQTDSLTVECDYDNSPGNQPVLNGQKLQPRQITWGEGSFDEMCLNYVWLRYDRDAYLSALKP
jgi:hypothetical protein